MKIILNEKQLKKIVNGEIDEIVTRKKRILGSGLYHEVYESNRYPNKVFKVGREYSVKEAYEYFIRYPYLFPEVYGYKKWGEKKADNGDDLYLLILEKLDTNKFIWFFNELSKKCREILGKNITLIAYQFDEHQEDWAKLLNELETQDKSFYSKSIEFFGLLVELNEIYDFPDVHSGQFGYDKTGELKCLDF